MAMTAFGIVVVCYFKKLHAITSIFSCQSRYLLPMDQRKKELLSFNKNLGSLRKTYENIQPIKPIKVNLDAIDLHKIKLASMPQRKSLTETKRVFGTMSPRTVSILKKSKTKILHQVTKSILEQELTVDSIENDQTHHHLNEINENDLHAIDGRSE